MGLLLNASDDLRAQHFSLLHNSDNLLFPDTQVEAIHRFVEARRVAIR
jgi:hypothetical protein